MKNLKQARRQATGRKEVTRQDTASSSAEALGEKLPGLAMKAASAAPGAIWRSSKEAWRLGGIAREQLKLHLAAKRAEAEAKQAAEYAEQLRRIDFESHMASAR
jgi:hypothetical protein